MISGWKRTVIENMASAFGGAASAEPAISEKDVEKLHAKIGQLVVERDASPRFRGPTGATVAAAMSEASSLILGTGGRKR